MWQTNQQTQQQQPTPSYMNLSSASAEPDPFDTSSVYAPQSSHRYYSHVNADRAASQYTSEHYSEIPSPNDQLASASPWSDSHLQHVAPSNVNLSELAVNVSALKISDESYQQHQPKVLDSKFLEELEKRLGKKDTDDNSNINLALNSAENDLLMTTVGSNIIPTLIPPPQSSRIKNTNTQSSSSSGVNTASTNVNALPCKVQNTWPSKLVNLDAQPANETSYYSVANGDDRLYSNEQMFTNGDTNTVFKRIWYEAAMKDNVNAMNGKQSNINGHSMDTGWSDTLKQTTPPNVYGSIQNHSPMPTTNRPSNYTSTQNLISTGNQNNSSPSKRQNYATSTSNIDAARQNYTSTQNLSAQNYSPATTNHHQNIDSTYSAVHSPVISVRTTEFGEFKCNQRSSQPEQLYGNEFNSLPRPASSQTGGLSSPLARPHSQFDVRQAAYGYSQHGAPVQVLPLENQRLYNEVDDIYSEVAENVYSQPAAGDVLRPHRPAPPSPLVLGYPQSIQQLQRKLGQSQVSI